MNIYELMKADPERFNKLNQQVNSMLDCVREELSCYTTEELSQMLEDGINPLIEHRKQP
jgi:hypothetical protein